MVVLGWRGWMGCVLVGMCSSAIACDPVDRSVDRDVADGGGDDDDTPDDGADEPADDDTQDTEDPPTGEPPPSPEPRPDAASLCDGPDGSLGTACQLDDGTEGTSWCIVIDGVEFDTPCSDDDPVCTPGDGYDYGCMGDICVWAEDHFEWYSWSEPDCNTPLVLQFPGESLDFAPAVAASFDLSTDGSCMSTDWPSAPWLAMDRDGDGQIRSGAELFGSATPIASGTASQGFEALSELDSNRDGRITAADARFGELVLWSDLDDDRIGAAGELRPIAQAQIVAIDLGFARRASCDAHGNCGVERAAFELREGNATRVGEVVDVHLPCR
ncbi:MAG: calcium-binding protein [Nannocystaceae bacterium]|nr:calcium-binding protein [Nannocystaceae bacterium]